MHSIQPLIKLKARAHTGSSTQVTRPSLKAKKRTTNSSPRTSKSRGRTVRQFWPTMKINSSTRGRSRMQGSCHQLTNRRSKWLHTASWYTRGGTSMSQVITCTAVRRTWLIWSLLMKIFYKWCTPRYPSATITTRMTTSLILSCGGCRR